MDGEFSKQFRTMVDSINGEATTQRRLTLEEALEMALEMTTIHRPGDPREHPSLKEQGNFKDEWI